MYTLKENFLGKTSHKYSNLSYIGEGGVTLHYFSETSSRYKIPNNGVA
jgi:hypothetical protein